ncbi:purine and uridine phosphorylase [Penicillium taxi]|uniref:purine and uridine phosphorylase n=1 Tax=Penicillium taxi TaxID=168475 RepID=UPI0025454BA0|nr:purine and uridine phosphorylase [Penicillium taxi]KAJ5899265.1 purine and uridine phosphorylase [Penicillium taxi]
MRVKDLAETAPLSWEIQQRLENQLLNMEHRTYLWLYLAMEDIRSTFENSLWPAEESIQMIPPSVNEAYKKILSRVPSNQKGTVRKVLQIIVGARRPLTTAELAMALGLALSPQSHAAAHAGIDLLQLEKKLRRLCGLFVFINNSKIYLIHQTAREFLIQQASSNDLRFAYACGLSDTENLMALICVQYLLIMDLEERETELHASQSFLEYSAVYWADHVRNMTFLSDQDMTDRLNRLYDTSEKLFGLWFPIFWRERERSYDHIPILTPLQLAAYNGHEQQVSALIATDNWDVNTPDDTEIYPIIWASLNGHDKTVQILLEQGADINATSGPYRDALQAACDAGHDKIAQMLLERGADVNAQGGDYGNAL